MNINELIKEFLLKNKGYLAGYTFFMLAYPLSAVYLPKYYGQVIEDIKNDLSPRLKTVFILVLLVNAMFLVLNRMDTVFIPNIQSYIRTNIVKVVIDNYMDNHENQEIGSLISKIVKLPIIVRELVGQIRMQIVPLIFILIVGTISFAKVNKTLGLMTITGILSSIAILYPMTQKVLKISSKMDDEIDIVHENISELFDNLLDIYSMNTYDEEMEKLDKDQKNITEYYRELFIYSNKFRTVLTILGFLVFFSVMSYAYILFKQKIIEMSDLISVIVTGMYIIGRISFFSGEIPDIVYNIGIYNQISLFVKNLKPKQELREDFKVINGDIDFKNLSISYKDKKILNNFNLNIKPGECVAIMGQIGCGKSSLAKALLKLIQYNGLIYVDGININDILPSSVRSEIIFVPQNPIPFNRTLYENIAYGNKSINKNVVIDMFKRYKLDKFFSQGLDTLVGKKGGNLSGGQRQMIYLLRVLLSNKKIIILDEPTSSLDENSAKYVMKLIKDIIDKRTVIIITHDKKVAQIANKIIQIQKT